MTLRWCECNHTFHNHHPGGGRCDGKDSYGLSCGCTSFDEAEDVADEPLGVEEESRW